MSLLDYAELGIEPREPEHCNQGSGAVVRADSTDGNGVRRCPVCKQWTVTEPLDVPLGSWRFIVWHRTPDQRRAAIAASARAARVVHSRDEDGVPEDMDEVTW